MRFVQFVEFVQIVECAGCVGCSGIPAAWGIWYIRQSVLFKRGIRTIAMIPTPNKNWQDELSRTEQADAEKEFRAMSEEEQNTIKADAYTTALMGVDSDVKETLEDASDDPENAFEWENIELVWNYNPDLDRDELTPRVGRSTVSEEAREFGWLYVRVILGMVARGY